MAATLTPKQVEVIRSTVPVLKEHGKAITKTFYDTLLREVPDMNNVFNQTNQVNNHQPAALATALYAYAANIDDLGVLSPTVENICHKHASLYIRPEQYETVGTYLLRAMGDVLGAALTADVLDAWRAAYWQLATIMIKREEQLSAHANGWDDWRDFRIADKVKESEDITSFSLQPMDGGKLPAFLPGQFVSLRTDVPELGYAQSRQYSLSDAPNPDYYRISVKRTLHSNPADRDTVASPAPTTSISTLLHKSKHRGDVVQISHPSGTFILSPSRPPNSPIILVSAGVGITPMLSILTSVLDAHEDSTQQPIHIIHTARTTQSRAFHAHLRAIAARWENVRYTTFLSSPTCGSDVEGKDYTYSGRFDIDKLEDSRDLFVDNERAEYFVCGPGSFMEDVEKGLICRGVSRGRIRMEVFGVMKA